MKITITKSEQPIIAEHASTVKKIGNLFEEMGITEFQLDVALAPEEEDAAISWLNDSVGKKFDGDGANGAQCKDYANAYAEWLGHPLKPSDASETWSVKQDSFWVKIPYKSGFKPNTGDLVIWDSWKQNSFGHIAVIIDSSEESFRSVDQNWKDSNLDYGSEASIITHNYTDPKILGYLRPNFGQ